MGSSAVHQEPFSILRLSAFSFFGIVIPVIDFIPFGGLSGSGTCETEEAFRPCPASLTSVSPVTAPTLPPINDPLFLASLTGAGTFAADIFLSLDGTASLQSISSPLPPVAHPSSVTANWSGTATIIYDYTPGPQVPQVPLPATLWLFGTALIGLVGFSKRRKAA